MPPTNNENRVEVAGAPKKTKAEILNLDPFPFGGPKVKVNQIFDRVADYLPYGINYLSSVSIHPNHFFYLLSSL